MGAANHLWIELAKAAKAILHKDMCESKIWSHLAWASFEELVSLKKVLLFPTFLKLCSHKSVLVASQSLLNL